MVGSARVDELKRKFDDNPRRYFVPLANEYRKAGDVERAIALCRAQLPQQPGHISGHIVLGQALFDAGQLGDSLQAFAAALKLDPENLIALRYCGEIARRRGDTEVARAWFQRVLDIDPRNDDVGQGLRELGPSAGAVAVHDRRPQGPLADAERTPAAVVDGAEARDDEDQRDPAQDLSTDAAPNAAAPTAAAGSPAEGERSAFDTIRIELEERSIPSSFESLSPSHQPFAADELRPATASQPAAPDLSAPDAPRRPRSVDEFFRDFDEHSAYAPTDDLLGFETAPAGAPSSTVPSTPTHGDESTARDQRPLYESGGEAAGMHESSTAADRAEHAWRAPAADVVAPSSDFAYDADAEHEWTPPADADETLETPPPAFVTETMAELYVQQGFQQQGIAVYRELLRRDPENARIRDRLSQLTGAPLEHTEAHAPPAEAPAGGYEAPASGDSESHEVPAGIEAALAPVDEDVQGWCEPDAHAAPDYEEERARGGASSIRSLLQSLAAVRVSFTDPDYLSAEHADARQPNGAVETLGATELMGAGGLDDVGVDEYGDPGAYDAHAADTAHTSHEEHASHDDHASYEDRGLGEPGALDAFGADHAADYSAERTIAPTGEDVPRPEASQPPPAQPPEPGGGTPAVTGRPTRAAEGELSLDRIFRQSGGAGRRSPSGSYSFDQFFSEGPPPPAPTDAPPSAPPPLRELDERASDIEQFNAWLDGLKRK